jgi:hypothetical protein
VLLDHFEEHEGFDGIMLGHEGAAFHLEFTRAHAYPVGRAPTQDNLLVFYLPKMDDWKAAVQRCSFLSNRCSNHDLPRSHASCSSAE